MVQSAGEPDRVGREDLWVAADRSVDGVVVGMPDGRILYANPAFCAMLRTTEEEIIRRGRQGISRVDDPRWKAAVDERALTGQTKLVAPLIRPDGSRFLAEVTSSVFTDLDGEVRTIVNVRDVTARVRLEQRSAALHEITQSLLSGTDTTKVLSIIARRARRLLEARDAAIFTTSASRHGHVRIAAVDGLAIPELLGREYPPASLAARVMLERRSQLVEDLTAAAATGDGRAVGLGPGIVVPIVAGERVFGAIMVGAPPGSRAYDFDELNDVKVFADAAAIALDLGSARAELEAFHRQRSEQLQRALESRVVVEQAKGFIAARRGISAEEAFARLRSYARRHSSSVHGVAARVMDGSLAL